MAERKNDKTGQTVAIVGGGALLLWLLLRGRGWGLGKRGTEGTGDPEVDRAPAPVLPPCRVQLDADGIQLDGAPADLPTTIGRCRATGTADVTATGAAIVGAVAEVVRTLQAQGVAVRASPAIWNLLDRIPRQL